MIRPEDFIITKNPKLAKIKIKVSNSIYRGIMYDVIGV
jgi:hypothetical protein